LLSPVEHVYVSFGTQPLVRTETIEGSLNQHIQYNLGFTLATVIMDHPYAPLLRDSDGRVCGSVETHLEGAEMPTHGETNIGAYWASRAALDEVLTGLHNSLFIEKENRYDTNSGELGFPNEMVRGCLAAGLGVDGVPIATEIEMMGIKTPETLSAIRKIVE
jgi:bifunctional N-acetylglucosamine-1-phosphate-uridyltransferase/glucosamine-1-phosphate-acetyltransferase GlmU-like protein